MKMYHTLDTLSLFRCFQVSIQEALLQATANCNVDRA